MINKIIIYCLFVPLFIFTMSCSKKKNDNNGFNLEGIRNAEYDLDIERVMKFTLENGDYFNKEHNVRIKLNEFVAFGDLNFDKQEDAVAVVTILKGNNPPMYNLAVLMNENGRVVNKTSKFIGEGFQVRRVALNGQDIIIDLLVYGKDDPLCCPSKNLTKVYSFNNNNLELKHGDVRTFYCNGTEPFWSLEIHYPLIVFKTTDMQDEWEYVSPEYSGDKLIFRLKNKYDKKVIIAVKDSVMNNGMSEEMFTQYVEVSYGSTFYSGVGKEENFTKQIEFISGYIREVKENSRSYSSKVHRRNGSESQSIITSYEDLNQIKYITEKAKLENGYFFKEFFLNDEKLVGYKEELVTQNNNEVSFKTETQLFFDESGKMIYNKKHQNSINIALEINDLNNVLSHYTELMQIVK